MRLSCEKYFVLVAIFVAFLLFRDPPRPARAVIRLVARLRCGARGTRCCPFFSGPAERCLG